MMIEVASLQQFNRREEEIRSLAYAAAESCFTLFARSPVTASMGSAFRVNEGVVTARHVLSSILFPGTGDTVPGSWITLQGLLADPHESFTASVEAISADHDLALLQTVVEYPPLRWKDSDQMEVGQMVVVLSAEGTIEGGFKPFAGAGEILAVSTIVPALFRYEIPVQPGSSGGPVILAGPNGGVIGINLLQERIGNRIVGAGLKSNTIQAVLAGGPPPREHPVLLPEGITPIDAMIAGGALGLSILIGYQFIIGGK